MITTNNTRTLPSGPVDAVEKPGYHQLRSRLIRLRRESVPEHGVRRTVHHPRSRPTGGQV